MSEALRRLDFNLPSAPWIRPWGEEYIHSAFDGDLVMTQLLIDDIVALRNALPSLLGQLDTYRQALTELADWDAHHEDCAVIDPLSGRVTDKPCSCGWSEIADFAREALGLEAVNV